MVALILVVDTWGLPLIAQRVERDGNGYTSFPAPTEGALAERIAAFAPLEYVDTKNGVRHSYRYRLFTPKELEPEKRYPLLVWLHGYGESGADNWRQLAHVQDEIARWNERNGGMPCFVLAPQSRYEDHWQSEMLSVVIRLVQHTIAVAPIDRDRVYVVGVSSGGTACWEIGGLYPEMFAALSPMASAGGQGQHEALTTIPIWVFHSTMDHVMPPDAVRATVAGIRGRGGSCWLTEIPTDDHDCWTPAFEEYDLIDWLLRQRRGSTAIRPPVLAQWKDFRSHYLVWDQIWPQVVLLCACFVLHFVARHYLAISRLEKTSTPENRVQSASRH